MATIHATAVLAGPKAVLVRGPSGSGKTALAFALMAAGLDGRLPFAALVADDRCLIEAVHGRLLVRAPEALEGLIERRGAGIREVAHEGLAVVGLVVDLDDPAARRMPEPASSRVDLCGLSLPRLSVAAGADALALVLDALTHPSA